MGRDNSAIRSGLNFVGSGTQFLLLYCPEREKNRERERHARARAHTHVTNIYKYIYMWAYIIYLCIYNIIYYIDNI